MVVKSKLPYLEGVSSVVILKTDNEMSFNGESHSKSFINLLAIGSGLSSVFIFCTSFLRIFVDDFTMSGKMGSAEFSLGAATHSPY